MKLKILHVFHVKCYIAAVSNIEFILMAVIDVQVACIAQ
jgi:hypothetical protein